MSSSAPDSNAPVVKIYTDGSRCSYKRLGFPCAWAAVFPDPKAPRKARIISGHALNLSDSGSAEVMAVTKALESLPQGSHAEFYIDNRELANLVERYSKMSEGKKAKLRWDYIEDGGNVRITRDRDALRGMFDALDRHTAGAQWIKSHQSNAHEDHYYNNMADQAARDAREIAFRELDSGATAPKSSSSPRRR